MVKTDRTVYENSILQAVWGIPDKVRGNCYVFSLGPKVGKGGYHTKRTQKAAPGSKCVVKNKCCFRYKNFDFNNCEEFIKRIVCDNPEYVKKLPQKASPNMNLPVGYHMMGAYLSPSPDRQDFHFVRRFEISFIKRVWKFLKDRTPEKAKQAFEELWKQKQINPTKKIYIWAHQRGWSPGGPIIHDAAGDLIRKINKINMNYGDLNYNKFCGFFSVLTRHATVTKEYDF